MKKILSLLICILLIASVTTAFAADRNAAQIFGYSVQPGTLDVLLYAKADGGFTADNFSLKLGGTEIPVNSLNAYADSSYATSWILIVEPTDSTSERTLVSALVKKLASGLKGKDNLAVYNAADVGRNEFLSSETTILQLTDSALRSRGDIKLYDSINAALDTFKTNTQLNEHKCLVVISECTDNGSTYSLDELCTAAAKLPISVYTVGITRESNTLADRFHTMSALARATDGGDFFSVDKVTEQEGTASGERVLANEKNCYVLTADLAPGLAVPAGNQTMTVSLQIGGSRIDAALEHVDGSKIQENVPAPVIDDKDSSEELTVIEKVQKWLNENWPIKDPIVNILAAVLLVALIVLLIVLISRKRKSKKAENINVVESTDSGTVPVAGNETKPLSKVTVILTDMKTGIQHSGEIFNQSIKAGKEAKLALKGDPAISREHMEFIWQNGCLYVQDINSTNGTRVNGKSIHSAVALNQSDVIHAGSSDFQVNWHSNS